MSQSHHQVSRFSLFFALLATDPVYCEACITTSLLALLGNMVHMCLTLSLYLKKAPLVRPHQLPAPACHPPTPRRSASYSPNSHTDYRFAQSVLPGLRLPFHRCSQQCRPAKCLLPMVSRGHPDSCATSQLHFSAHISLGSVVSYLPHHTLRLPRSAILQLEDEYPSQVRSHIWLLRSASPRACSYARHSQLPPLMGSDDKFSYGTRRHLLDLLFCLPARSVIRTPAHT